ESALAMNDRIVANPVFGADPAPGFSGGSRAERSSTARVTRLESIKTSLYIDASLAVEVGAYIDGNGASGGVRVNARMEQGRTQTSSTENVNTVGYVLEDDSPSDIFDMQVGIDPVFGTPIFILDSLGTQSSCPYEGGYQLDQPELTFSNGASVDSLVGVPNGSEAVFRLNICNNSRVPRSYNLRVRGNSNPNGAKVSAYGDLITTNQAVGIQIDTIAPFSCLENVVLTVQQNAGILNYEDMELLLYVPTECQPATDPIESLIHLTARFDPATNTNDPADQFGGIDVLPNPTSGAFQLRFPPLAAQGQLDITDTNGRQVFTTPVARGLDRWNGTQSRLPRGIYVVSLTVNQRRRITRLVVQ
ncbi:MAG: T9SS type A sorting domain-containing protein, partial [Bacteroidota bacterium]